MTSVADNINFEKDKAASLNYALKLDDDLPPEDPLASVSVAVTPALAGGVTVDGLSWADRTVTLVFSGGVGNTWYTALVTWGSVSGLTDQVPVRIFVTDEAATPVVLGSDLFPNRYRATAELRTDRLMRAAATSLGDSTGMSDDYLWGKLLAAEVDVKHILGVPFRPTRYFPNPPTADAVAALNGMPYGVDPGYDYEPGFFNSDAWGFLQLRNRPLVSVESVRIVMPSMGAPTFDLPVGWIRMDRKYAQLQFVPNSQPASGIPLNAFMMQVAGMGRTVPFAMEVTYTAGITSVATSYPELVDVVKKKAVLSILEDQYHPQSSSISADGLSQSMSIDMDKYQDAIDRAIYGGKGSNGGIIASIYGARLGVA